MVPPGFAAIFIINKENKITMFCGTLFGTDIGTRLVQLI